MAIKFSDNFNRADSDTLGGNWAEYSGDADIASNMLSCASTAVVYNTTSIGSADYSLEFTFNTEQDAGNEWIIPFIRASTTGSPYDNAYLAYLQSNTTADYVQLLRRVGGSQTQLGSTSTEDFSREVKVKIKAVSTTISIEMDDVEKISQTDSSHTTEGYFGLRIDAGADCDNCMIDDLASTSNYTNSATITIDNTKVSGSSNLTNFPILFSGTYAGSGSDPDLRTTGNGGDVTDDNGSDIAFYSDSDLTTKLDHELMSYTASTGAIIAWVKIPTLSYNSDTTIYIGYGDSTIEVDQTTKQTWSSYDSVWHLEESSAGTAKEFKDSAGNNYGTGGNTPTQQAGVVGNEQLFDNASTEYIDLTDTTTFDGATELTITAWISTEDATAVDSIVRKWTGGSAGLLFDLNKSVTNGNELHLMAGISDGTNTRIWWRDNVTYDPMSINTDYHAGLGWKYDAGSPTSEVYLDGESQTVNITTTGNPTSINNSTERLLIGGRWSGGSPDNTWDGTIDEVRMAKTLLGADWVKTEYNTYTPSTFYSISTGGATPTISASRRMVNMG